ncbi:MAG: hypothetical protein HMLKMBBP_03424 [Planctomycetes bacterium]|nr:hypothetical protein [Planctomycetota bacterium]
MKSRIAAAVVAACALAACGGEDPPSPAPAAPSSASPSALPSAPVAPAGPDVTGGFVESAEPRGLRFRTQFLAGEQGILFKINLYDHGSGIAVADYDGDGDDDVYMLNQLGRNALFRNDGHGLFADVTDEAGVAVGNRICVMAVFGDADGDGDQDLYVTTTRGGNILFRNDGGRFTDVTKDAGLTLVAHSETPIFFDADLDGDLDLFVTNTAKWTSDAREPQGRYHPGPVTLFELAASPAEKHRFYRNDGGMRFVDVTQAAGLEGPGWGGDVAAFDVEGDGDLDLFVTNMFGQSILYRNDGKGAFEDATADVLGRTCWGAVGARVFDADGDGNLDLFVADMHSDMWSPIDLRKVKFDPAKKYDAAWGPMIELGLLDPAGAEEIRQKLRIPVGSVVHGSVLFRAEGGGRFREVSDASGVETWWPWGAATADFDADGDEDMYLPTGMGYPYAYYPAPFLRNDGTGKFADAAKAVGLEPLPGGEFQPMPIGGQLAARSQRAAVTADFDADGRPDLLVSLFNDRAHLFMNRMERKPWIAFRLKEKTARRDAVGAVVRLRAGGRTMVRQVQSSGGYLAQSSRTLHFGLGGAAEIDRCEVIWPGGKVHAIPAPRIGSVNEILED